VMTRSSLSAIGSTSLPKSEIQPYLRARWPSQRSENAATRNRMNAISRAVNVGTNARNPTTGASAMRAIVIAFGRALRSNAMRRSAQRLQDELAHGLERVEHADAVDCDCLVLGQAHRVELPAQLIDRHGVRQVALVPLEHDRQLVRVV